MAANDKHIQEIKSDWDAGKLAPIPIKCIAVSGTLKCGCPVVPGSTIVWNGNPDYSYNICIPCAERIMNVQFKKH